MAQYSVSRDGHHHNSNIDLHEVIMVAASSNSSLCHASLDWEEITR